MLSVAKPRTSRWNSARATLTCEINRIGGGEKGIRTLETVTRLHTFQACAFDHSAISPRQADAGSASDSQPLAAFSAGEGAEHPSKGARNIPIGGLVARPVGRSVAARWPHLVQANRRVPK